MHVVYLPNRTLVDREALAAWTHRSVRVIRQHCRPVAMHGQRVMYDVDECVAILNAVPQRRHDVSPRPRAAVESPAGAGSGARPLASTASAA